MTKTEAPKETKETKKPTCFVIMPISDTSGYEPGHFKRVYDHILKPAVEAAGYEAIRADDSSKSDYIVVAIVQQIIESDMVLCDLSSRNPNVMYELGMRHSFNKPVTLIKDSITDRVFDIQGLRCTEYEARMRIDDVQRDVEKVKNAIIDTSKLTENEINSVLQLAKIKPAKVLDSQEVSPETNLILRTLSSLEKRIDSFKVKDNDTYSYWGRSQAFPTSYLGNSSVNRINLTDSNNESYVFEKNEAGKEILLGTLIDYSEDAISIKSKDGSIVKIFPSSPKGGLNNEAQHQRF